MIVTFVLVKMFDKNNKLTDIINKAKENTKLFIAK